MAARTGQRFIDGMASDEALFRYLMDNAIAYKDSLQLSVGVGLSAEQVAALTHDIVWLVTEKGTTEKGTDLFFDGKGDRFIFLLQN